MDLESIFVLSDGVLFEAVEGDTVILHPTQDAYFEVNDVGAVVLHGVQDRLTVTQVIDRVTEKYDVDRNEAAIDVETFLADLIEADLIVPE